MRASIKKKLLIPLAYVERKASLPPPPPFSPLSAKQFGRSGAERGRNEAIYPGAARPEMGKASQKKVC